MRCVSRLEQEAPATESSSAVRGELDRVAHRYLARERADHTLETAALVNEAYLKLIDQNRVEWQGRAHFMAIAAQVPRPRGEKR